MPPEHSAVTAPRRSIEMVSIWALFATLVAAIFIFIPSVAVPFTTTKTFLLAAGVIITLALYILARLGRGNVILPPFMLIGALWLPVLAYILSATFSGTLFTNALWGSSLEPDTLGFMFVATILATLAAFMLRRPEHYRSFLTIGSWVLGVVVVLQVLVVVVGQFWPNTIAPAFSILGSLEDLAFFLGLGIIGILITLREINLSKRAHYIRIAILVGSLFLLAIANSTLVWTLVALISLGLFVETIMQRKLRTSDVDVDDVAVVDEAPSSEGGEGSHSLIVPLAVLAVSLFFLIPAMSNEQDSLANSLSQKLNINIVNVRPSWESTLAVGQKVYATAPVFGSGPGTFGIEWLKYRDASLNSTVFWNVDFSSGIGFVPTSFVTTGLIGIIAWVLFLGLFIMFGLRMLILRAPQDAFIRHVALLSFVASVYFFIVAIFGLPSTVILALAFVFAGIFVSTTRYAANSQQWGIVFARSPRLGFLVVFSLTIVLLGSVAVAYSLVGHYIATSELAKSRAAFSTGNLDIASAAAKNSIVFAPSAAAYQIEAGVASVQLDRIAASSTMSTSVAQQAFQAQLSGGINAALTATRLSPSDYQNWIILGNLYAKAVPLSVAGAYDSAKTAYEKGKMLNPTNPQIPYILAQLDIAHRDIKAAKSNLKEAIMLKQDYIDAIFLLSQLEVQDGNVKDALTAALAAAYFTPNNPNILYQVGILSAAQNDFVGAGNALAAAVEVSPQFANARYILSAIYAKRGDMKNALAQMQAIADMSNDNAVAVASQLADLKKGKNPFPANLLSVSPAPVK